MTGRADDMLVIGLDGVPHWLLRQLADRAVMPHLAKLLPQATLRPLRAPIPDISSTSWASFLTGADCGTHGIYGFVDLRPGSYQTYFPNLRDLRATPVWQPVGASGRRSVVLNVPGTYPAPPMRGVLLSGFVAPDFDRAVYPPEVRGPLRDIGYQLDVTVGDVHADPFAFMDRVDAALAARREAFRHILDTAGPTGGADAQLAVCVYTETDRVHHFLWRDLMDENSPVHGRILEFYGRLDTAVQELAERAGDGALMIVSDHGFGPVTTQFHINAWLRQAGYLALPRDAGSLTEIDETTTAFALDPGRIFLNRADRFPRGRELPVDELVEEITAGLLALRRTPDGAVTDARVGEPVVAEVLRGVDLYQGPCREAAADLVIVPAPDVQVRGSWAVDELTVDGPLTGTHTREDALFWLRGDHGAGTVEMRDVAPTVLGHLRIAPPPSMEGRDVSSRGRRQPHRT
ncbi:alkaline phosphatase family protein [Micromonospora sp. NPDC050397]|uniref:alkaline phosphatase family protein n=1 Tax=Micromonospora sp. NPDC050397 TaxID=3364279 RepID=UPI00384C0497